jgi:aminoglycoside phosphotransferase family enzyme/predicted kinase
MIAATGCKHNQGALFMAKNGQGDIFAAMEQPDFYHHPVEEIQKRETHISKVFLTGRYAYKIKKPVDLGFLDFTSLEKRRHFCHQEVTLNRRLAPDVYLDVIPITQENNRYFLSGPGQTVEYAVKMRQLPDECSMRRMLRRGSIDEGKIHQLAERLSDFYQQAAVDEKKIPIGSWETVYANCEENFSQTEIFKGKILDERMFQIIQHATRSFLQRRRALFAERIANEKIRDCHGDLRTGHIYFANGIKIIDCVEFNDRFRYADIACDLAFLAMDIDFEGFPEIDQQLLETFIRLTNDDDIFILIDFYKCYRAFVRVKVNCLNLKEGSLGEYERRRLLRETEKYLELAYGYALNISRPTLWIICGMIGSGKSTIAERLSQTLDVKVLRSDVIRKDLFDLKPDAVMDVPFGEGIYSEEVNRLTYGKLLMLAQEEIKKGCSVILDATFNNRHYRSEAQRLSQDLDTDLILVECVASLPVIRQRLLARETDRSVSDARLHHLKKFKNIFEPLTEAEEKNCVRINTEDSVEENIHKILSRNYT